jgi:hypothetical protein
MLKADGFMVRDLDLNSYMEVRSLTQKYIDDFLGYWIDSNNSQMSSLLVGCGLPGGMMGSMMADLKNFHVAINAALKAMGFRLVFDTNFSADLTIMEEANEFIQRVTNGGKLPLFTSCCPAWVR